MGADITARPAVLTVAGAPVEIYRPAARVAAVLGAKVGQPGAF
jgi:hypothetical protein